VSEPAPVPERADEAPTSFRGKALFPFQRRAAEAIHAGKSVVVAAPTGAGKTLVADVAIARALAEGKRVAYTSPIKALSNQKYRDFRADHGEDRVGILTGDVTIAPDAPLLVMTTEIFRNTIFEAPERLQGIHAAIFDEVHYLDDPERGTVWEESILYAPPHVRIVALSATVPNVAELAAWIAEVRDTEVEVVVETRRPVPLEHRAWVPGRGVRSVADLRKHPVARAPVHERRGRRGPRAAAFAAERATGDLLRHLTSHDLLPALVFVFARRDCERLARAHASMDLLEPEGREELLARFDDLARRYETADAPSTRELRRLAAHGALYHHAGMLPIDKEIVERLFTTGLVRLLFATETFALGVNMPARSVAFHTLRKFDGVDFATLRTRDYRQMAGRAGRQGMDRVGHVFSVVDPSRDTWRDLERLTEGEPEPVRSRFNLDYSTILNLYDVIGDRVTDAWKRSFARYRARRARGKAGEAPEPGVAGRSIRSRLEVLRRFHHLTPEGLTRKGRIASRISGYEIACTEAYESGVLSRCGPVEAAMLFAAFVYEARPNDEADPPIQDVMRTVRPLLVRLEAFRRAESAHGVPDPVKRPDFGVAGLAEAWAEGEDFAVLESMGSMQPGDIVRLFRMTIQILRQTAHAIPPGDPAVPILHEAVSRLDRGVVDAKRQLELG
jgi:superfamily II RNA helicase